MQINCLKYFLFFNKYKTFLTNLLSRDHTVPIAPSKLKFKGMIIVTAALYSNENRVI